MTRGRGTKRFSILLHTGYKIRNKSLFQMEDGFDTVNTMDWKDEDEDLLASMRPFFQAAPSDISWIIFHYVSISIQQKWILTNSLGAELLYPRLIASGFELEYDWQHNDWLNNDALQSIAFAMRLECWRIADWLVLHFKLDHSDKAKLENLTQKHLLWALNKPHVATELIRFFHLKECSDAWLVQLINKGCLCLAKDFHDVFELSPFRWEQLSALLCCIKHQDHAFCFWLRQLGVSLEPLEANWTLVENLFKTKNANKMIKALCGPPPHFGPQQKIYLQYRESTRSK